MKRFLAATTICLALLATQGAHAACVFDTTLENKLAEYFSTAYTECSEAGEIPAEEVTAVEPDGEAVVALVDATVASDPEVQADLIKLAVGTATIDSISKDSLVTVTDGAIVDVGDGDSGDEEKKG